MSVFEEAGTVQSTQTSTEGNEENQDSFVKKLVETRGEQWSDPEVIAKGKLESDKYIEELEGQLSEMREDLSKQDYAKSLLETLQGKAGESVAPNPVETNSSTTETNTTDDVSKIESLVNKAIQEREAAQSVSQNLKQAEETLTKAYGTDASKVISEKASELGMSVNRLQEIAGESPSAFMRLIGEKAETTRQSTNESTVNTQSEAFNHNSGDRNFAYYQKMRRENKKLYYSPAIQNAMFQDRARLGDSFYPNKE